MILLYILASSFYLKSQASRQYLYDVLQDPAPCGKNKLAASCARIILNHFWLHHLNTTIIPEPPFSDKIFQKIRQWSVQGLTLVEYSLIDEGNLGEGGTTSNSRCAVLPQSPNWGSPLCPHQCHIKGCAGAVWKEGDPSEKYCTRNSWYRKCCRWANGICQAKSRCESQGDMFMPSSTLILLDPPFRNGYLVIMFGSTARRFTGYIEVFPAHSKRKTYTLQGVNGIGRLIRWQHKQYGM